MESKNLVKMDEGTYKGYYISRGANILKENIVDKKTGKVTVKKHEDYGRCYYNVGLRVNRDISLTALEFLGPPTETINRSYQVWILIQTELARLSRWLCQCLPRAETEELINMKTDVSNAGERFTVKLKYPVRIEAGRWTDIKFVLEGSKTTRLAEMEKRAKVLADDSEVVIDFLLGSRQLSGLFFTID